MIKEGKWRSTWISFYKKGTAPKKGQANKREEQWVWVDMFSNLCNREPSKSITSIQRTTCNDCWGWSKMKNILEFTLSSNLQPVTIVSYLFPLLFILGKITLTSYSLVVFTLSLHVFNNYSLHLKLCSTYNSLHPRPSYNLVYFILTKDVNSNLWKQGG